MARTYAHKPVRLVLDTEPHWEWERYSKMRIPMAAREVGGAPGRAVLSRAKRERAWRREAEAS